MVPRRLFEPLLRASNWGPNKLRLEVNPMPEVISGEWPKCNCNRMVGWQFFFCAMTCRNYSNVVCLRRGNFLTVNQPGCWYAENCHSLLEDKKRIKHEKKLEAIAQGKVNHRGIREMEGKARRTRYTKNILKEQRMDWTDRKLGVKNSRFHTRKLTERWNRGML